MAIKTGRKAVFNEINITPLTDIFLVLLIIMMVVAPTFQSIDNTITIPEINSGTSIEQGKVVVSVTKDGTIYVDSKKTSPGMLVKDLEVAKAAKESTEGANGSESVNSEAAAPELVVKADEKVKSSVIMEIMDAAQDAHYKKLIVAGEPLNKKDQKKLEEEYAKSVQQNNVLDGASTALPQDSQYEKW